MSAEFFHRHPAERGVFKRVRSVIIRPSQTPATSTAPRGILTRSMSARGDVEKRKRAVLRRQNAMDDQEQKKREWVQKKERIL